MQSIYTLVRYLGTNGFLLGSGIAKGSHRYYLTVIKGIHYIKCESELQTLKKDMSDKRLFGHILYIDAINVPKNDFKPIKALHTSVNPLNNMESHTLNIHNVIPRPTVNGWIGGIFIGDKNIKEVLEPNNFYDSYEGGIIEIMADHIIPKVIEDINKIKKTVGIFVNYGARVVLKTEKLNIDGMTDNQRKTVTSYLDSVDDLEPVSILLLGGSFIWLETEVEFRFNTRNENICEPIHQFLVKETQFYKKERPFEEKVPLFILTKTNSGTEWGIQIKLTPDHKRVVTIEAPHDWMEGLVIYTWDQMLIERLVYKTNYAPKWDTQDSLAFDSIQATTGDGLVLRTLPINLEAGPDLYAANRPIRSYCSSYTFDKFITNKLWLYYMRREERFQIITRSEQIPWKVAAGQTGPLFILDFPEQLARLVFTLLQDHTYGTFLYVIKQKPNKQTDDEYTQIHAIIVGKSEKTFNCKPVVIQDILWKRFDDNVWIRGIVIGGIDVIRKRPLRIYKRQPESDGESETQSQTTSESKSKNKRKDMDDLSDEEEDPTIRKTESYKKLMKKYQIRRKKSIQKNIAQKLVEYPKVIEDWNYCQEIRTDFILPDKKKDIPFDGKVIGLFIPSGVSCVLINSVVDEDKFDPLRDISQSLDRNRVHPILLMEKTFVWIEGILEMNLLEDKHICHQPLEHPILKQLIIENYIFGETEDVEDQEHLYGKVLFLHPIPNQNVNWSIEVSPLIYPTYESRVLYLNIPSGGKIEIQNWDRAFTEIISSSNFMTNNNISDRSQDNQIKLFPNIPLKRWINRDFKQRVYDFLEICVKEKILIEIPKNKRQHYLRTREAILDNRIQLIKKYEKVFHIYENKLDKDLHWFFIRYQNFYLDHYGMMKFNRYGLPLFETLFKHHFYDQFV